MEDEQVEWTASPNNATTTCTATTAADPPGEQPQQEQQEPELTSASTPAGSSTPHSAKHSEESTGSRAHSKSNSDDDDDDANDRCSGTPSVSGSESDQGYSEDDYDNDEFASSISSKRSRTGTTGSSRGDDSDVRSQRTVNSHPSCSTPGNRGAPPVAPSAAEDQSGSAKKKTTAPAHADTDKHHEHPPAIHHHHHHGLPLASSPPRPFHFHTVSGVRPAVRLARTNELEPQRRNCEVENYKAQAQYVRQFGMISPLLAIPNSLRGKTQLRKTKRKESKSVGEGEKGEREREREEEAQEEKEEQQVPPAEEGQQQRSSALVVRDDGLMTTTREEEEEEEEEEEVDEAERRARAQSPISYKAHGGGPKRIIRTESPMVREHNKRLQRTLMHSPTDYYRSIGTIPVNGMDGRSRAKIEELKYRPNKMLVSFAGTAKRNVTTMTDSPGPAYQPPSCFAPENMHGCLIGPQPQAKTEIALRRNRTPCGMDYEIENKWQTGQRTNFPNQLIGCSKRWKRFEPNQFSERPLTPGAAELFTHKEKESRVLRKCYEEDSKLRERVQLATTSSLSTNSPSGRSLVRRPASGADGRVWR